MEKEASNLNNNVQNKHNLVDISTILIDKNLPYEQRMKIFVETINNPYHFIIKGTPIYLQYSEDNISLEKLLKDSLRKQKSNKQ